MFGLYSSPLQRSCYFNTGTRVLKQNTLSLKGARRSFRSTSRLKRFFSEKSQQKGSEINTREVIHTDRFHLYRPATRHEWSWSVDPQRVLVLLMPWVNAKEKHIAKYCDIYLGKGLDVLCMSSKLGDFLWPPNSFGAAEKLMKILQDQCRDYDHYFFHSLSMGSYNLTVFHMLASEKGYSKHLSEHTSAVVYDSIVAGSGEGGIVKNIEPRSENDQSSVHAIDRMIRGISDSVKANEIAHKCISVISKLYFSATKSKTFDFYVKAVDNLRQHPIKAPTLIFGSRDDPMCDPNTVEQLVDIWKKESNLDAQLQLWDSSAHAQHLIYHRKEYLETLNSFLAHVFGPPSSASTKVG